MPKRGLEPPRAKSPLAPQASASTNSATSARPRILGRSPGECNPLEKMLSRPRPADVASAAGTSPTHRLPALSPTSDVAPAGSVGTSSRSARSASSPECRSPALQALPLRSGIPTVPSCSGTFTRRPRQAESDDEETDGEPCRDRVQEVGGRQPSRTSSATRRCRRLLQRQRPCPAGS